MSSLMLDAFIIEKIRRERQARESDRQPLHVEIHRDPQPRPVDTREHNDPEHDSSVVDFEI